MSVSNSHREALEALFAPAPVMPSAVSLAEELIAIPENLDASIEADANAAWDYEAYRWYRGLDVNNITRVFRFQRGLPLSAWQELLRTQHLIEVRGPFRAQALALR